MVLGPKWTQSTFVVDLDKGQITAQFHADPNINPVVADLNMLNLILDEACLNSKGLLGHSSCLLSLRLIFEIKVFYSFSHLLVYFVLTCPKSRQKSVTLLSD